MLTGKCKKDFEKWLFDFYLDHLSDLKENKLLTVDTIKVYADFEVAICSSKPLSMQYGVYVDFFDSVGMQIYIKPVPGGDINKLGEWSVYIDNFGSHILTDYIKEDTRQEARIKAIQKANEIYNKNNL